MGGWIFFFNLFSAGLSRAVLGVDSDCGSIFLWEFLLGAYFWRLCDIDAGFSRLLGSSVDEVLSLDIARKYSK